MPLASITNVVNLIAKFSTIETPRDMNLMPGSIVPLAMIHIWFGIRFIGDQMAPLALVQYSASSWPVHVAPLALVPNLVTEWGHSHYLQIWSPDGATCMARLPRIAVLHKLILSWYLHEAGLHQ